MAERKPTHRGLIIFEYLATLLVGSLAFTTIIRNFFFGEGHLFLLVFVLPIGLAVLLAVFSCYYCVRIFTNGDMGSRIIKSIGLAIVSCVIALPLSYFFLQAFFPPYNYGPGP